MSKSLEALDKIVEKYDWLGKEYCRLIGKGDELHKVNQTAFVECLVTPIKHDLERKEELEKENLKLKQDILSFEDYSYDLDCEKQQLEKENLELKANNKEIEKLYLNENKHWCETIDSLRKENKKLTKAIEILKEKFVNIQLLITTSCYDNYCMYVIDNQLTEQEYELLKEVLGNE